MTSFSLLEELFSVRVLLSSSEECMAAPMWTTILLADMDGTVTVPCMDFEEMRRRTGVPPGLDILDEIKSWKDAERRARAYAAIEEIEEEVRGIPCDLFASNGHGMQCRKTHLAGTAKHEGDARC